MEDGEAVEEEKDGRRAEVEEEGGGAEEMGAGDESMVSGAIPFTFLRMF